MIESVQIWIAKREIWAWNNEAECVADWACIWINVDVQFRKSFIIQLYYYIGSSGKFCVGKFEFWILNERARASSRQEKAAFFSFKRGILNMFDSVPQRWRTGNNIFKQYYMSLCFRGGARRQGVKFGKFLNVPLPAIQFGSGSQSSNKRISLSKTKREGVPALRTRI